MYCTIDRLDRYKWVGPFKVVEFFTFSNFSSLRGMQVYLKIRFKPIDAVKYYLHNFSQSYNYL